MIYTEQTVKAMKLCYQAHHGQTDKAGVPYVFHPIHLAEQMDSDGPLAANAVVASSALASITMFGWIFLFKCLGMF